MAGLVKAKKYDWKDSNMALFGSDTEKQVKKESAECEPAWKGAGQKPGLQVWRIVKFKVEHLPREDYGEFYNGDSYIILNTYTEPESDELKYDVHFWIGQYSTQDEYGTAAYKTVELDTFLDDLPVQHREVMGHESDLFKSYFPSLQLLKGGADTGFRKVEPKEYKPRLLHFKGNRKGVVVKEVALKRSNLTSDDVFILDTGAVVYQWTGSTCNKDEKYKVVQFIQELKSARSGRCTVEVFDERDDDNLDAFYDKLKECEDAAAENGDDDDDDESDFNDEEDTPALYRLSDASGEIAFDLQKEGDVSKGDFESQDVFVYDTKKEVFVWVGRGASVDEKRNAMTHAHNYLMKTTHPLLPISVISEGRESSAFVSALAA